MVKRGANTNLNHDNWDEEDEREERGTFTKAADEVLRQRVIKTAKRRNNLSSAPPEVSASKPEPKNIFSTFGGFTKTTTPTIPSFNFLQQATPATTPKPESSKASDSPSSNSIFKSSMASSSTTSDSSKSEPSSEYLSKLRGLNESVSKWIQTHVSLNPLCNLEPIFRDYERYFSEIEGLDSKSFSDDSDFKCLAPPPSIFANMKAPNINPFLQNSPTAKTEPPKDTPKPAEFSFGSAPAKSFQFGNGSASSSSHTAAPGHGLSSHPSPKGFSFGGSQSTPFKFQNVFPSAPPSDAAPSNTITIEDDEEEPPKAEFVPVVEEGHVFSQRCKVFVKKAGAFAERGVGQLFLKPIPDKDKYQLIVRADTNIGNLLVNIVLSESIPTQRMGKNNVMLACIPLPEDKEPTPVLLRVKTAEDADELLEVLEKHKK